MTQDTFNKIEKLYDEIYRMGYQDGVKDGNIDSETLIYKIQEAYNKGLTDAWKCARKINRVEPFALTEDELNQIFTTTNPYLILRRWDADEAMSKIKEYDTEHGKVCTPLTDFVEYVKSEIQEYCMNADFGTTRHDTFRIIDRCMAEWEEQKKENINIEDVINTNIENVININEGEHIPIMSIEDVTLDTEKHTVSFDCEILRGFSEEEYLTAFKGALRDVFEEVVREDKKREKAIYGCDDRPPYLKGSD